MTWLISDEARKHRAFREVWVAYLLGGLYLLLGLYTEISEQNYSALGLGGLNGFNLTGDGLVLLSAVSAGAGALVSRIYTPGRDPMLLTGWQLLIGGCFLLGVGTAGGGALGRVTLGGVLLLGYMIALSAAAFTIWTALLGKFPVGKVSLFGFLIPVFGTLFSALVLGENILTVRNLAALVLVSGGIAGANSTSTKK